MQFGQQLRSHRRSAGLSQEELAERAGVTANAVSSLERGVRTRPYPNTVRALADALHLDADARERLIGAATGGAGPDPEPAVEDAPGPVATVAPPVPPTELVGRDHEIKELAELLGRPGVRLVTLTGAGGVGKTRLAVEVARSSEWAAAAEPPVFVALASLTDPALVPSAVAMAAGLHDSAGTDAPSLVRALEHACRLLVLDNFEHVLAAGPVVAALLAGCPRLTLVVTSRAPLRVRGEHEFPVQPLGLPGSTRNPSPKDVHDAAAGALFVERARAVSPSFCVTEGNAAHIAAICWRLGGLPLALELAAARVRSLSPADLLARLDVALSAGWARDLPARQQTMRATLDWSYQLLEPQEQTLLELLSPFAGSFDLAAAEAVAGPVVGIASVLPLLDALVEQSLVAVAHDHGGTRYSLLEPVREYAAELLAEHGRAEKAARAFAAHYLAFAERAAVEYRGPGQVEALRATEAETANLRAAITGALARGDGETAARMCWELWLAWWIGGGFGEGQRLVVQALDLPLTPHTRTRALLVRAASHYAQSDFPAAAHWWQAAAESAVADGDPAGEASGLAGQGLAAMTTGDLEAAERGFRQALTILESMEGEEWLASLANIWLGTLLLVRGNAQESVPVFDQALAGARARGDRLAIYIALFNLASAFLAMGDADQAEVCLRESVALSQQTRDTANLAFTLDGLAVVEGQRGAARRSAVLLGAAEAMRVASEDRTYHYYLPDEALRSRTREAAQAALGDEFAAAEAEGLVLDLDGAVALAS